MKLKKWKHIADEIRQSCIDRNINIEPLLSKQTYFDNSTEVLNQTGVPYKFLGFQKKEIKIDGKEYFYLDYKKLKKMNKND